MSVAMKDRPTTARERTSAAPEVLLEHVNVTVADPDATARLLGDLFGWRVRWSGESKMNGYSVHVGGAGSYLALYRGPRQRRLPPEGGERASYGVIGGLNHIAVVVSDIEDAEARVRAAGIEPYSFGDYEPGLRFYFNDPDGIEYEVVAYP